MTYPLDPHTRAVVELLRGLDPAVAPLITPETRDIARDALDFITRGASETPYEVRTEDGEVLPSTHPETLMQRARERRFGLIATADELADDVREALTDPWLRFAGIDSDAFGEWVSHVESAVVPAIVALQDALQDIPHFPFTPRVIAGDYRDVYTDTYARMCSDIFDAGDHFDVEEHADPFPFNLPKDDIR